MISGDGDRDEDGQPTRTPSWRYKVLLGRVLVPIGGIYVIWHAWAARGPVFGVAALIGFGPMILLAALSPLTARSRESTGIGMPRSDAAQGRRIPRSSPAKKTVVGLLVIGMLFAESFTGLGLLTRLSVKMCALVAGAAFAVGVVGTAYKVWDDWQYARRVAKRTQ